MRTMAILFGLALATPAQAQLYKCVDGAGRTTYRDRPCPSQGQGRALKGQRGGGQDAAAGEDAGDAAKPGDDSARRERIRGIDQSIAQQEAVRADLYHRMRYERSVARQGPPPGMGDPSLADGHAHDEWNVITQNFRAQIDAVDDRINALRRERQRLLDAR